MKLFKEPSTWAGIGVIAGAPIPVIPAGATILQAIVGLSGGLAIIMREGKGQPTP